jgi:hypothetical protein
MASDGLMILVAKVPAWFPGAGFKRIAREWRGTLEEMVSAPHEFVKDQMVNDLQFYDHALKLKYHRLLASLLCL